MKGHNVPLDNRIYCLQMTMNLPNDLSALLHEADVLFLQDKDDEAEDLVSRIECDCNERGVHIFSPSFV